jgi:hypothetical protein
MSQPQPKSATMILNVYKAYSRSAVVYEEYTCNGHSEAMPRYGCRVYIDDVLRGVANDYPNKKSAREAAASEAAKALAL